jgi:regulator of replication initiation timing
MNTIKVCEPVSVPVRVLAELQDLRALILQLQRDNEQLRADNERLQQQLQQAQRQLGQAERQGKRRAAPFSKGPPKDQPKLPGVSPAAPTAATATV